MPMPTNGLKSRSKLDGNLHDSVSSQGNMTSTAQPWGYNTGIPIPRAYVSSDFAYAANPVQESKGTMVGTNGAWVEPQAPLAIWVGRLRRLRRSLPD